MGRREYTSAQHPQFSAAQKNSYTTSNNSARIKKVNLGPSRAHATISFVCCLPSTTHHPTVGFIFLIHHVMRRTVLAVVGGLAHVGSRIPTRGGESAV
jgi:hypothetical protein